MKAFIEIKSEAKDTYANKPLNIMMDKDNDLVQLYTSSALTCRASFTIQETIDLCKEIIKQLQDA